MVSAITKIDNAFPLPQISKIAIFPPEHKSVESHLSTLATCLFDFYTERWDSLERQIVSRVEYVSYEKKREAEKLLEAAEKAYHSNAWDYLKLIAGALLGTVSIIVGSSLIGIGGPAGWITGSLLITSGATSITAALLSEFKVNPNITSIVSLTSAGLGLIGSAISLFAITDALPHLIATISSSAFAVASGTVTVGAEEMKRQLAELEYEMSHIRKQLDLDDTAIKALSNQVFYLAEDMQKNVNDCQVALTRHLEAKRKMIALQIRE